MLINAARALDPKKFASNLVSVSVFERKSRLVIQVDDTGSGMSQETVALGQALSVDYSVVCVSSGNAALERIRRGDSFHVVLCDVLMRGMTGPGLRVAVQRLSPSLAKSFIFLSEGCRQALDLLAASGEPCLQKPVCFVELSAEILRHISDAS